MATEGSDFPTAACKPSPPSLPRLGPAYFDPCEALGDQPPECEDADRGDLPQELVDLARRYGSRGRDSTSASPALAPCAFMSPARRRRRMRLSAGGANITYKAAPCPAILMPCFGGDSRMWWMKARRRAASWPLSSWNGSAVSAPESERGSQRECEVSAPLLGDELVWASVDESSVRVVGPDLLCGRQTGAEPCGDHVNLAFVEDDMSFESQIAPLEVIAGYSADDWEVEPTETTRVEFVYLPGQTDVVLAIRALQPGNGVGVSATYWVAYGGDELRVVHAFVDSEFVSESFHSGTLAGHIVSETTRTRVSGCEHHTFDCDSHFPEFQMRCEGTDTLISLRRDSTVVETRTDVFLSFDPSRQVYIAR